MTVIPFPDHFLFGTSLSSHQSEGGNTNSWTEWENIPGHIKNGEKSGAAAEHWSRYVEDFENLKWLSANTHRFSVEWSRLEPEPGRWNNKAFKHYREMIVSLRERGVLPILCLFHFSVPIWVSEKGAFENTDVIDDFRRFAKKCYEEFGDLVDHWLTL
jgi:beta-glucosidase